MAFDDVQIPPKLQENPLRRGRTSGIEDLDLARVTAVTLMVGEMCKLPRYVEWAQILLDRQMNIGGRSTDNFIESLKASPERPEIPGKIL